MNTKTGDNKKYAFFVKDIISHVYSRVVLIMFKGSEKSKSLKWSNTLVPNFNGKVRYLNPIGSGPFG